MGTSDSTPRSSLDALRQLAQQRGSPSSRSAPEDNPLPVERCEFCGATLPDEHQHLLAPASRQLACACDRCAVVVGDRQDGVYKRVPRRARYLAGFQLDDALWDSLAIPVGMAFFFRASQPDKVIALYPSPAGATESQLDLQAWAEVAGANPILLELAPDVEALLVNRVRGAREYYLAPIDQCYELVGLIRANWRGLSGGKVVWEEIARFLDRLKERSAAEDGHA
jgi:hypothetical protein